MTKYALPCGATLALDQFPEDAMEEVAQAAEEEGVDLDKLTAEAKRLRNKGIYEHLKRIRK